MVMSPLEGYSACTMRVWDEGEGELRNFVNSVYSKDALGLGCGQCIHLCFSEVVS